MTRFRLGRTAVRVEEAPWYTSRTPGLDALVVSPFVNSTNARYINLRAYPSAYSRCVGEVRREVWGRIKMSESGVPLDRLFTSDGQGRVFSLVPEPRSLVSLQRAHFGPGAIPNTLADIPCTTVNTTELLNLLNDVFGTGYSLDKPGLEQCLDHFLRTSQDFGQVYGSLRSCWKWRWCFTRLLSDLAEERTEDEATRRNAVNGDYISNSQVPPRRVWDLYSNRVLPFYARVYYSSPSERFEVWTVSHSWVHKSACAEVWTPINGYEWPVLLPNDTTLDHVRVELLNLGAEYVWLDVLCLRQRGRPEDEEQRKEEWKLDVPTIGHVYSLDRPCVTYFNGLGLPFDPSPRILSSDRHWFNRAWTVQEATDYWLPGGATGEASADTRRFFREYLPKSIPYSASHEWKSDYVTFAATVIQGRHCTTELDRVHGLAYILNCKTLPIYDERMSPDLAWAALLKHMSPHTRFHVALRHARCHPASTSLLPSWWDFMQREQQDTIRASDFVPPSSDLRLLRDSHLHTDEPETYYHTTTDLYGPVGIYCEGKEDEFGHETLKLQTAGASDDLECYEIRDCKIGGTLLQGTTYVILRLSEMVWLVVEVIGERQIEKGTALEVVKRGCILSSSDRLPYLRWYERWYVVYISEEARRKK
ncbi:uncharacterized protein PHACADRAFT_211402 [Phanerochaete carnosa HHB-10118-sp]|uniref:Heterokaryon incompatibility domain-containing protein n=1 Tax=Phanerochaete carnosa (strain HHB-10118-sp) TaxID=650164 RepID=K5W3P3_PHACS|nr:uncharacterized protein PHACADRAFT_211402 [Phanerochaete carnosa HHB-10118-sp]EKM53745.1 hypothetical protein PHACADRAFT_211402 [Phanerochaete carnosa HHB-10118-sp]